MKVVVHLSNRDRIEKENVVDFRVENGFVRIFFKWRNLIKEMGINIDDIHSYVVVEDAVK